MDINRARQLIDGMGKLDTGYAARLKPGVNIVLFRKVEEAEVRATKAPMLRAAATVIVPVIDKHNKRPDEEDYCGHYKGEEVGWIYRFGDRFNQDFSPFLICGMSYTPAEAAGMTQDDIDAAFAAVVRGKDAHDERGIFDDTLVMEITAMESNPVVDKRETAKRGTEVLTTFVNIKGYRKIPLSDLVDKLDEDDMARYFGSFENFVALMEAEAE